MSEWERVINDVSNEGYLEPPLLLSNDTTIALLPASRSTPPIISGGGIPIINPVLHFLLYSGIMLSVPDLLTIVLKKSIGLLIPNGLVFSLIMRKHVN